MISTHIRTEGLYVKTTIIYQLKRPCVPDCAYTENMFINSIHISLYDIPLTQNILYQKRRGYMKETRMPPAQSANLVANNGSTIYGVSVIAQQTLPVRSKVYQASPHLGPVNVVWLWKTQKPRQTSCGHRGRVSGGLPCRRQLERAAPVSLFSGGSRRPWLVEDWSPRSSLSWWSHSRAGLGLTVLLGERDWWLSYPVGLPDGTHSVLKDLGLWT